MAFRFATDSAWAGRSLLVGRALWNATAKAFDRSETECYGRSEMERFRPAAGGSASVLGPLESAVLNTLWDSGPATVGEVVAHLAAHGQDVHYSSAKTTLNTLVAKGYARKRSVGRANAFAATLSRADFDARVVEGVLSGLMRNYRNPLLSHLAEQLAQDDASLEEFRRLIEQHRGDKRT